MVYWRFLTGAVVFIIGASSITGGYTFGREVGEGLKKTMPLAGLALVIWVIAKANQGSKS